MTYGPAALACFYFGMSLLEGKSVEQAMEELKMKFLPSYKVSSLFFPVVKKLMYKSILNNLV